ncbi:MAG: AmmeMemoRadiSam system protein B [Treponema sp.]|nr:AmmeMemoRadiSam system protein B [Treponema sp.]
MKIREYLLPMGWYPRDSAEISRFLSDFTGATANTNAAIAPHAGWFYSGRTAALACSGLNRQAQTVVVIGGHLPGGSPPLFAMEDAVRTPQGILTIDTEMRSILVEKLGGREDQYQDNTVEVLLPMVRFFLPETTLLWVRLPADSSSFEAGKTIAQTAEKLNRKINVLASTDLTHYGRNYGFSPHGAGRAALKWVKEVNDFNFIRAVEDGNCEQVLVHAERDKASCSAGAVLGAMGFAKAAGLGPAQLLEYTTSADIALADSGETPDSFVGYAALAFGKG